MGRLTSKRTVLLLVLLTAGVLLVSGSRVWVTGSVDDPVLGAGMLHGTGSQVARGVLAAALVGAAAVVAAATSGRLVRRLAAAVVVLAGALGTAVIASVIADPDGALGRVAATGTGRTGDVPAHGSVTLWVWVARARGRGDDRGRRRGPGRSRPLERPVQPVRRARRRRASGDAPAGSTPPPRSRRPAARASPRGSSSPAVRTPLPERPGTRTRPVPERGAGPDTMPGTAPAAPTRRTRQDTTTRHRAAPDTTEENPWQSTVTVTARRHGPPSRSCWSVPS